MTKIRNFTPHSVNLFDGDSQVATFPSQGVARVSVSTVSLPPLTVDLDGVEVTIPFMATELGSVEGLPDATPGVVLVVSRIVAAACPNRKDLVVPDDLVRDSQGRVVGCRRFALP